MLQTAIKMLLNDRSKYLLLVSVLAFSTFLITQQIAIFFGVMLRTTSTLNNIRAPIWVVDPNVVHIAGVVPIKDTDLTRVASVQGVSTATPLYYARHQVKLNNGKLSTMEIFGVETATLTGAPATMIEGDIKSLWQPNGIIVDQYGLKLLSKASKKNIKINDTISIRYQELKIVGICKVNSLSFFGDPIGYTTYETAKKISNSNRTLSFILVTPMTNINIADLTKKITEETGLLAYTHKELLWSTMIWYCRNTVIPIAIATTVAIGIIVGIAVAGQTFYAFITENLDSIGALKAMGINNRLLCLMLILQAITVGSLGYGIGVGFATLFGFYALQHLTIPYHLPYIVPFVIFFAILCICMTAAWIGIRKINRLTVAEVFRT